MDIIYEPAHLELRCPVCCVTLYMPVNIGDVYDDPIIMCPKCGAKFDYDAVLCNDITLCTMSPRTALCHWSNDEGTA